MRLYSMLGLYRKKDISLYGTRIVALVELSCNDGVLTIAMSMLLSITIAKCPENRIHVIMCVL